MAVEAGDCWIRVDDALCRVARDALLRIDRFRLGAGQHWCLFGGNGSGKSLFAAYLAGRLSSARHRIHYHGLDPVRDVAFVSFEEQQRLQSRDRRHDISEYQSDAFDAGTTVRSLVAGRNQDPAVVKRLLESLGLCEVSDQGIRYLSSGQTRRTLIAAALASRPALLILDEPLESIDRDSRERIARVIREWQSPGNASIVLNRRVAGVLPGMTHVGYMRALCLEGSGPFPARNWRQRLNASLPPLPASSGGLPNPAPGHPPVAVEAGRPLIEMKGVSIRYGNRVVVDGLDWVFMPHHHTLVEGPNGCGKSSLLALLVGDSHKAYGQAVSLFGRRRGSGESVWEVKSLFGLVSNELHNRYVNGWSVLDVVVSGFYDSVGLYDSPGSTEVATARQWLAAVGAADRAADRYHELSFGEQRLVLLARAMVKYPPLLVLDEPCVGLDDRYRHRILTLLDRIADSGHTRLLYVSHTTGEAPVHINQHLTFVRNSDGVFRVRVEKHG